MLWLKKVLLLLPITCPEANRNICYKDQQKRVEYNKTVGWIVDLAKFVFFRNFIKDQTLTISTMEREEGAKSFTTISNKLWLKGNFAHFVAKNLYEWILYARYVYVTKFATRCSIENEIFTFMPNTTVLHKIVSIVT